MVNVAFDTNLGKNSGKKQRENRKWGFQFFYAIYDRPRSLFKWLVQEYI